MVLAAGCADPPPHLILGLSNVSQKCANRHLINRIYLVMAMTAGMDAVIADPTDTDLMNAVITAEPEGAWTHAITDKAL